MKNQFPGERAKTSEVAEVADPSLSEPVREEESLLRVALAVLDGVRARPHASPDDGATLLNAQSYPEHDQARRFLHVAMTRAAHQLWTTYTGKPSPLLL